MAIDSHREVTIHEFKNNIARYLRELDRGDYDALLVTRYNEPVGMFLPVKARQRKMIDDAARGLPRK